MFGIFLKIGVAACLGRNLNGYVKSHYCTTYDFLSKPVSLAAKKNRPDRKGIITRETVKELEKLSLVNFGDERGIKIVEDAISYADQLEEVNTEGVEPLVTVLEDELLYLREDIVKSDVNVGELLSCSAKTTENYYLAPIENVECVLAENNNESDSLSVKN